MKHLAPRLFRSASTLRILAYHRIVDLVDEEAYPFDPELISASPAEFRWQMQYLKQYFNPISFHELLVAFDNDDPVPHNAVIVTFDDGFEDNYTEAYPVLSELGVPATIFLTTGYIGGVETYWFDAVVNCLMRMDVGPISVPALDFEGCLDASVYNRRQVAEELIERMKTVSEQTRLCALREILDSHPDPEEIRDNPLSRPMRWEQVQELSRNGIEFGSHTVSHPILKHLEPAQLDFELRSSRQTIEEKTGREAEVVAYPVGGRSEYSDHVVAAAREAGYRLGASYVSGVNKFESLQPYELRRIHVERYMSRDEFQAALWLPGLFRRK